MKKLFGLFLVCGLLMLSRPASASGRKVMLPKEGWAGLFKVKREIARDELKLKHVVSGLWVNFESREKNIYRFAARWTADAPDLGDDEYLSCEAYYYYDADKKEVKIDGSGCEV